MKKLIATLAIVALAVLSLGAAEAPADSFRLSVQEIVQKSGCRVLTIKVAANSGEMISIRGDRGAAMASRLTSTTQGPEQEATIVLAAIRGEESGICHSTITVQESFWPLSFDLQPGQNLESALSLAVTSGIYKLNNPIVLGKRNGEVLRLTVGKWSQAKDSR